MLCGRVAGWRERPCQGEDGEGAGEGADDDGRTVQRGRPPQGGHHHAEEVVVRDAACRTARKRLVVSLSL